MAGANYMGGRRNAAKARSKDVTGMAQKRFFGRQRLDILTRSLACTNDVSSETLTRGIPGGSVSDIQLAHAKKKSAEDEPGSTLFFIPSPIRISPCTPKSRSRKNKLLSSTTGSSGGRSDQIRSSKILEALDTTEPMHIRAAMDRVLALPDLAGLSRHVPRLSPQKTSKRSRECESSPSPEERKKRRITSQETSTKLPPAKALEGFSRRQSPSPGNDFGTVPTHEVGTCEQEGELGDFDSMDIASVFSYDPSYSDFEASLDGHQFGEMNCSPLVLESGFKGPSTPGSRSHCSDLPIQPPGNTSLHPSSKSYTTSSSGSTHSNRLNLSYSRSLMEASSRTRSSPQTPSHSISHEPRIATGSGSNDLHLRPASPFAGNLFEYEDPWKAVGMILGLEPQQKTPLKKRDLRHMFQDAEDGLDDVANEDLRDDAEGVEEQEHQEHGSFHSLDMDSDAAQSSQRGKDNWTLLSPSSALSKDGVDMRAPVLSYGYPPRRYVTPPRTAPQPHAIDQYPALAADEPASFASNQPRNDRVRHDDLDTGSSSPTEHHATTTETRAFLPKPQSSNLLRAFAAPIQDTLAFLRHPAPGCDLDIANSKVRDSPSSTPSHSGHSVDALVSKDVTKHKASSRYRQLGPTFVTEDKPRITNPACTSLPIASPAAPHISVDTGLAKTPLNFPRSVAPPLDILTGRKDDVVLKSPRLESDDIDLFSCDALRTATQPRIGIVPDNEERLPAPKRVSFAIPNRAPSVSPISRYSPRSTFPVSKVGPLEVEGVGDEEPEIEGGEEEVVQGPCLFADDVLESESDEE